MRRARHLLSLLLVGVGVGCSLDGLTGGEDPITPPNRPPPPPICTTPEAPQCVHGYCAEENAAAKCICDSGWTGTSCAECAIGAACSAPTCAETQCAAHSTCDESGGAPTCKCITGYSPNGTDCKWTGTIKDPGFSQQPANSWIATGGVTINAFAAGAKDPGEVELRTAQCEAASIKQSFAMPPYESAEPLALEISARGRCDVPFFNFCLLPIGMLTNGRGSFPYFILSGNAPTTARVCLGDRAYAPTTELSFFASSCAATTVNIALDRVDIVAAPECPALNVVPNADFEGVGGWTASGVGAEVAAGVGNQSSRGGKLRNAKTCDEARLSNQISVSSVQPAKPALTFTMKGTQNRKMAITFNGANVGTMTGTSVYEKASFCIPEVMRGVSGSLSFYLASEPGVVCGDPDEHEFVIDDLAIENDESCTPGNLMAGDFERADTDKYWSTYENGGSIAFVRGPGANAHSGSGHAQMVQYTCARTSTLSQNIQLPVLQNKAAGGPAVELFYKATVATGMTYTALSTALEPVSDWTKKVLCISPRRAGFSTFLEISAAAAPETCTSGTLMVDDVRAVLDPSCPAE